MNRKSSSNTNVVNIDIIKVGTVDGIIKIKNGFKLPD